MTRPLLGILCGMEAEAAALGRWRTDPRVVVSITAGRPDRAEAEATRLAAAGPRALLSWGIAGGLAPDLWPGALLIADGVIAPGGRPFAFDPILVAASCAALPGPVAGGTEQPAPMSAQACRAAGARLLAGATTVQLGPAAKVALGRHTGAAAVDMESHAAAAAARAAALGCLAVRVVSDPANRRLPALATNALDAEGRPHIGRALRGLARRPWDLPVALAARRDSRVALAALAAAAETIVPALLIALEERPAN